MALAPTAMQCTLLDERVSRVQSVSGCFDIVADASRKLIVVFRLGIRFRGCL